MTQGTIATDPENLLVPTLRALAEDDVLVVPTTGATDRADLPIDRIPDSGRVERFVPFTQLLPHVHAMVSNGGYGGVQLALASGVPIVVAGTTEDKTEVGARVRWFGVGIRILRNRPGEKAIRRAVHRLLGDASFREAAARHQEHGCD